MTLDELGNLYLTRKAVTVYNRNAEKIATIEVPEEPANVCFGGKTLYITARTGLYALKMNVRGQ
jgi:gluconolactonase